MGQVLGRFRGKKWRQSQLNVISHGVFDCFKNDSGRANLSFEDLYIAVLLVYNDINKRLPGPHFDPPSKDQVRAMMQECDIDLNGELDREEFVKFMHKLTADTFIVVSQGLIITLAVAPTVALLTKRATEGVPGVGQVVKNYPIQFTHPLSLLPLCSSRKQTHHITKPLVSLRVARRCFM